MLQGILIIFIKKAMYLQILTGILGLIIGSFLTACIYRIPLGRKKGAPSEAELRGEEDFIVAHNEEKENISICYPPRSFCPSCKKQLKARHNFPFFSWLFLLGKCAYCKTKIPFRYPLVELLSASAALLSFNLFDINTAIVVYAFTAVLILISFIDIDYYIIPDVVSIPATIISIVLVLINSYFEIFSWPVSDSILNSFYGVLAGAGVLFAIAELFFLIRGKIGLGFGDVKLLLFTGILFGPMCALFSIFVGSFIGTAVGIPMIILSKFEIGEKFGLGTPLPFGPYLAIGAIYYIYSFGHNPLF